MGAVIAKIETEVNSSIPEPERTGIAVAGHIPSNTEEPDYRQRPVADRPTQGYGGQNHEPSRSRKARSNLEPPMANDQQ